MRSELDAKALEAAARQLAKQESVGKCKTLEEQIDYERRTWPRILSSRELEEPIRAYLAALPQAEPGWRPIETAPKDGTDVLISGFNFDKPEAGRWVAMASFADDEWAYETIPFYPPTHWHLLPTALTPAIEEGR